MTAANYLILVCILVPLTSGNHIFTSNIYKNLRKDVKGSLIVSPLAAETVLADIALLGASGDTKKEIISILALPDTEEDFEEVTENLYAPDLDNVTLTPAYRFYISNEYTVNCTFVKKSRKSFGVDTQSVNLADKASTAKLINTYVEDHSRHRLNALIDPKDLSGKEKLILVNTLYESNLWKNPLGLAGKDLFYSSPKESKKIDYLSAIAYLGVFHCAYLKATFLELPYKYFNKSFVIILPDNGTSLDEIEGNILDYLAPQTHNRLRPRWVSVKIPKFDTTFKLDFKKYLQAINVKKVFSPTDAELPGVTNKKGLYVNYILQKSFINITELGNDPPTLLGCEDHLEPVADVFRPPIIFSVQATRSFIYYIRDTKSTLLYFVGRFNNK
ncbi:hypothetical protein JTB14_010898 [Gonioctena quinquepunctata]|nr:hypothetical protein JTB14_010898 [Gonioctena quinquepunctata]